jgi:hypothetical protein
MARFTRPDSCGRDRAEGAEMDACTGPPERHSHHSKAQDTRYGTAGPR